MSQYPPIVPMFHVSDPRASIAWFEKLGFANEGEMAMPDGSIMHAEMSRGAARLMLGPAMMGTGAPGLALYFPVESGIDDYFAQVQAAGVTVVEGLTDQFWGDRTFMIAHPDGFELMFAQPVRQVSAEEMQQAMARMAAQPAGV